MLCRLFILTFFQRSFFVYAVDLTGKFVSFLLHSLVFYCILILSSFVECLRDVKQNFE